MLVKEYLEDSKTKCLLIRGYKLFVSEEGQFKLETKAELKFRDYIDYDWTEEEKEKYLTKLKEDVEKTMNAVIKDVAISPRNQEIILIVERQSQKPTMEKKIFMEKHEGCETRERKEAVKRAVKEAKEEALAKAEELVFPELKGTEKQISWAESIRKSFFVWCESVRISPDIMINGETGAKFWIDHKDKLFPGSVKRYVLYEYPIYSPSFFSTNKGCFMGTALCLNCSIYSSNTSMFISTVPPVPSLILYVAPAALAISMNL